MTTTDTLLSLIKEGLAVCDKANEQPQWPYGTLTVQQVNAKEACCTALPNALAALKVYVEDSQCTCSDEMNTSCPSCIRNERALALLEGKQKL